MSSTHWCVIPAAGRGARFGGDTPKQYVEVAGRCILLHTLDALLSHPRIAGAMVALSVDGARWPKHLTMLHGKPVRTCVGGESRASSVAKALAALTDEVDADDAVLVHDAARPNIAHADLDALFVALAAHPQGAILAAPVRDTLKRADAAGDIVMTEPRESLWRAFTPQAFPRDLLTQALADADSDDIEVTDEAMAMERMGIYARLVEGREDNFKITTPADLARFEFMVSRR